MTSFSLRNEAGPEVEFLQQAAAPMPWGHPLKLQERSGAAVANFDLGLPKPQSDLAGGSPTRLPGIEQIERELTGDGPSTAE